MGLQRLYSDNILWMFPSAEAGIRKSVDISPCHMPICASALPQKTWHSGGKGGNDPVNYSA